MLRRFVISILFFSIAVSFAACGSFIREDQIEHVKVYENGVYRTKKQIEKDKKVIIEKDVDVRLHLVVSKNWIKVYAYPADADFLKTDRTLMVYMFEDDFDKKLFNEASFREKLNEYVERR